MGATREDWAVRIKQWRQSGQTAREFAAGHGLNHNTLQHWAWRLRAEAGGRGDAARRSRGKTAAKSPAFVEVMSHAIADGCFELEVSGKRRLRIPPRFDVQSLERLLALLEARQ